MVRPLSTNVTVLSARKETMGTLSIYCSLVLSIQAKKKVLFSDKKHEIRIFLSENKYISHILLHERFYSQIRPLPPRRAIKKQVQWLLYTQHLSIVAQLEIFTLADLIKIW